MKLASNSLFIAKAEELKPGYKLVLGNSGLATVSGIHVSSCEIKVYLKEFNDDPLTFFPRQDVLVVYQ